MKVKKGLSENLKALDPHLCGGEGMHPGDDADTVIIVFHLSHVFNADFGSLYRREKLHTGHVPDLLIKEGRHPLRIFRNLLQAFRTIQILAANYKIQLRFIHLLTSILIRWVV